MGDSQLFGEVGNPKGRTSHASDSETMGQGHLAISHLPDALYLTHLIEIRLRQHSKISFLKLFSLSESLGPEREEGIKGS